MSLAHEERPQLNQETQEFFDNIVSLFFHVREGHVGRYCFSAPLFDGDDVRGNDHWSDFIASAPNYYMYHDEAALIGEHAEEIGKTISDASEFIDLGTGSITSFEKKVIPIVRSARPLKFIFVDACRDFAEHGNTRLKQEKFPIKTEVFIGNFWESLPTPTNKAAISLQGSTLGNMIVNLPSETMEEGLLRTFTHFAAPLKKHGGYFLFTYDTNHDPNPIALGYEHPSYHAMEMTILRRVKRDLPNEGFDPDAFEHVVLWYPDWHLSAHAVRAKQDISFKLGQYRVDVKKGEFFRTGSSFKFTDQIVSDLSQEAGFSSLQIFSNAKSPMHLAIAHV